MTEENHNHEALQKEESRGIPEILPILPVLDVTLFPRMVLPLVVQEKGSQQLIDEAMAKDRLIGIVVSKKTDLKMPSEPAELYDVGTVGSILKMSWSRNLLT